MSSLPSVGFIVLRDPLCFSEVEMIWHQNTQMEARLLADKFKEWKKFFGRLRFRFIRHGAIGLHVLIPLEER